MTLIVSCNAVLQPTGTATALAPRRRRLSTIMARHAGDRRVIPLVFRKGQNWREATAAEVDRAARLRKQYASTLVGPHDTVVLYRPVRGKNGAAIGLALAAIALIAISGPAGAAISGAVAGGSFAVAFAVKAAFVIGAAALSYAASRASAANKKSAKGGDTYASLQGGGNVARVGDRRPLVYGRCWTSPPLSQRDWFCHMPTSTVVYKRMTLGLGKFKVHNIRIGESLFWNEDTGIQFPFNQGAWPGTEAAMEVLYDNQPSLLMVGDAVSSDSVTGQELPRPLGNPAVTPWFRLTPQGVKARKVLLNWTYLALGYSSSKGERKPAPGSVLFEAQKLEPGTGNPTGPIHFIYQQLVTALKTSPVHQATVVDLPGDEEWQIRGRNMFPENEAIDLQNAATWDGMTALIENGRTRAQTTEITMRVSGIKGLPTSSLSDVQVEATRILPVWKNGQWVEEPTKKAIWAYADLIRAQHGLGRPDNVDVDKFYDYANRPGLFGFDEFNGVLPSVSSFWEASSEILSPLRAEPVKIGSTYSFVRDESAEEAGGRRVITRRQIIRDSSEQRFDYTTTESENGDVIIEYDRDGDPKRPDEARQTIFAQTRTPKRLRVNGLTSGIHAIMMANWVGARSLYRGSSRKVTTEWDGRLIYPGTHIAADLWYIEGKAVVGVAGRSDNNLILDAKPSMPPGPTYALIRNRKGREWGILPAYYDGEYELALDGAGVTQLASLTGVSLENVIARETQDPTTVMIGPITELQKTYMARSAIPSDQDNVEIEMIYDDPRVWLALAEPIVAPGPLAAETPPIIDRPIVPAVTARCERIETSIELVWGIATAIGAVSYDAQISYDAGVTYEDIQTRLATQSGRVPIRQSPDPVFFRARGYGETGLPGPYQVASFTTVPPQIDAELVDMVGLTIENFNELVQDLLVGTGPGSIGEAKAKADEAQTRADDAFAAADEAFESAQAAADAGINLRRALSVDPAERALSGEWVRAVRDDIDAALAVLSDLQDKVNDTQGRLVEMGVEKGPDGVWRVAGLARTDGRVNTVSLNLDALAGKVQLLAGSIIDGNFDGLIEQINQVSLTLDSLNASLQAKVDTATFGPVETRVGSLELSLDGIENELELKASQQVVQGLSTTLSNAVLQLQAQGALLASVTSSSAMLENEMRDATIDQILARLAEMDGVMNHRFANANLAFSARADESNRVVAEMARTLLAVSGLSDARYSEIITAIASGDQATLNAVTALSAQVNAAGTGLPATLARLIQEEQASATRDAAQTTARQALSAQLNNPGTGLAATLARVIAEEQARASADAAEASLRAAISSQLNDPTTGLPVTRSQFVSFQSTQGTANAAFGNRLSALESTVNSGTDGNLALKARIATEEQTQTTRTNALATRSDSLEATVFNGANSNANIRASLVSFQQAQVGINDSFTSTTTSLTSRVGANEAAISDANVARANADSALSTLVQQARAVADGGTAEGRFGITAVANPAGADLTLAITGRRTTNDSVQQAGFYIVFPTGGGPPEIVADVGRFRIGSLASRDYAFELVDGVVRLKKGLIAPGAIATSKLINIPPLTILASGQAAQSDVQLYGYDVPVQYELDALLDIEARCSVRAFNATVTRVRIGIFDVLTGNLIDSEQLIDEVPGGDEPTPVRRARYFVRIQGGRPYVIRYIFDYASGLVQSNFRSNGMSIRYLAVTENQI